MTININELHSELENPDFRDFVRALIDWWDLEDAREAQK